MVTFEMDGQDELMEVVGDPMAKESWRHLKGHQGVVMGVDTLWCWRQNGHSRRSLGGATLRF
jgi:hypothetical protein